MIVDQEVEDFLEHYGVKGQKWGVQRRSKKAKVGIAVSAIGAGSVASTFTQNVTGSAPLGIIAGTGSAILGGRAARTFVDRNATVSTRELGGGKHIKDKGLSQGEKAYVTFQGFGLAMAILAGVATKQMMKND